MFKSAIAAVVAAPFLATSALAGPYVNVESNAGFPDGEYSGATTDLHVVSLAIMLKLVLDSFMMTLLMKPRLKFLVKSV